jgi:hypothetical protein
MKMKTFHVNHNWAVGAGAAFLVMIAVSAWAQGRQSAVAPEMGMYGSTEQWASLRPGRGLIWQRTSPSVQQPDGPVLYQLIFNASGVPGRVPVFDTNPRHLTNSPIAISGGNVVIGGGNGVIINGATGIINFASGQTFPASGSLAGEVTGPVGANVVSNAVSTNTANAIVRRDASGNFSAGGISANFLGSAVSSPGATVWFASNQATTGASYGISGYTSSAVFPSAGVFGSGPGYGVWGQTNSTITSPGSGVIGVATATTGTAQGVQGFSQSPKGVGVYGADVSASNSGQGIRSALSFGAGVWGDNGQNGLTSIEYGVLGTADDATAGFFYNNSPSGFAALIADAGAGSTTAHIFEAYGQSGSCFIDSTGSLHCSGTISGSVKAFRIDHPLDPANKYLVHASVESSEMKNIYDGVVITDAQGEATVELPDWFEALNGDFRYQLTVIGQFAQAIVAREIQNHEFAIKTSLPNVKVSWQVTGVRQDKWAKAHALVVEQQKEERLRGSYIHPELYGAPKEKGIGWAHHPELMKRGNDRQPNAQDASK